VGFCVCSSSPKSHRVDRHGPIHLFAIVEFFQREEDARSGGGESEGSTKRRVNEEAGWRHQSIDQPISPGTGDWAGMIRGTGREQKGRRDRRTCCSAWKVKQTYLLHPISDLGIPILQRNCIVLLFPRPRPFSPPLRPPPPILFFFWPTILPYHTIHALYSRNSIDSLLSLLTTEEILDNY
jgi:hypothetical protein